MPKVFHPGPRVFNKRDPSTPSNAVYIGRGSLWGNPFIIGQDGNRNEVCDAFEKKIRADPAFMRRIRTELRGRNLVCFCKPLRCHGDFLLKVANSL